MEDKVCKILELMDRVELTADMDSRLRTVLMGKTVEVPNKSKYHIRDEYEAFDLVMDLALSKATDLPLDQLIPLLFAVKYLVRAGRKPGTDDLKKAENYIHKGRTGGWND